MGIRNYDASQYERRSDDVATPMKFGIMASRYNAHHAGDYQNKCLLVLPSLSNSLTWKFRKFISTTPAKHNLCYGWWRFIRNEELRGHLNSRVYVKTNPWNLQPTPRSSITSFPNGSLNQETKDTQTTVTGAAYSGSWTHGFKRRHNNVYIADPTQIWPISLQRAPKISTCLPSITWTSKNIENTERITSSWL